MFTNLNASLQDVGILLVIISLAYFIFDWLIHRSVIPTSKFTDRYIIITGCDSGFGSYLARRLDKLGFNVVATCLTNEGVALLKEQCSSRLVALQMDVTDEDSVQEAYKVTARLLRSGKCLWGLVNNAGISGPIGPFEWLSQTDVTRVSEVNVFGMIRVVRVFLPLIKRSQHGGRIVNMASILGRLNIPFASPYCMSKCSVEAYSDALRIEVRPYNIKVSIVEPGAYSTNFLTGLHNSTVSPWERLPDATKDAFGVDYLHRVVFLCTKFLSLMSTSNINGVVGAYEHALLSKRPHRRYLVGLDAKILLLTSYLPSFVLDFVLNLLSPVPASCRQPNK